MVFANKHRSIENVDLTQVGLHITNKKVDIRHLKNYRYAKIFTTDQILYSSGFPVVD